MIITQNICAAVRIEKRQKVKTRPKWSGENFGVHMAAGVVPPLLPWPLLCFEQRSASTVQKMD